MSASRNNQPNSPNPRDLVEDPELTLAPEQAAALSPADQQTARRQRHLDTQLKAAVAEVHSIVDQHQPDGDSFMLRLQNSIEAHNQQENRAAARRDAESYLSKMGWRQRLEWLRERFIFSENHGLRVAAALGVFALGLMPLLLSGSDTDQASMAMSGSTESADSVPLPADAATEAVEEGIAAVATVPADDAQPTPGPRLATAAAPDAGSGDLPPIPDDAQLAEDLALAREALERAGAVPASDPGAGAQAKGDPTQLQIDILQARLKQAETVAEKRLILRALRGLYLQAGQQAKVAEVDRALKAL